jgi:hypothetical protein
LPEVKDGIGKTSGLIPLAGGPDALKKQTAEHHEKWQPIAARARREYWKPAAIRLSQR